ncbi:MAG: endonuclease domain-containing protein [Nitrospira sp.]|nr:endonuclease domain-containing protein [Nitrospira sp.]
MTLHARRLRRSLTDAEQALWRHLRLRQVGGHKFRRQQPIGSYIVDFVCFEKKLIVEVDGGQHAEKAVADTKRSDWLAAHGFRIVRFWNHEVLADIESVVVAVRQALELA